MTNRFFVDFKETSAGDISGTIKFSKDSVFVLESLAEIIGQFSEACGVPPDEIVCDLLDIIREDSGVVLQ